MLNFLKDRVPVHKCQDALEFLCDEDVGVATEHADVFDVLDEREFGLGEGGFERFPFAGEDGDDAVGFEHAVDFFEGFGIERPDF